MYLHFIRIFKERHLFITVQTKPTSSNVDPWFIPLPKFNQTQLISHRQEFALIWAQLLHLHWIPPFQKWLLMLKRGTKRELSAKQLMNSWMPPATMFRRIQKCISFYSLFFWFFWLSFSASVKEIAPVSRDMSIVLIDFWRKEQVSVI